MVECFRMTMPDMLNVLVGRFCSTTMSRQWTACLPDLNPTEHIWDALDHCMCQRNLLPQTLPQPMSLPTPMSHICLCLGLRWIPRDAVSDMYRVILIPQCLHLWLLVSCLPGLVLNFEIPCQVSFLFFEE